MLCVAILVLFSLFVLFLFFLTMESILFPGVFLQELCDFTISSFTLPLNPFAVSYTPRTVGFRLNASAQPWLPTSRLNPSAIPYFPTSFFGMNPFADPYVPCDEMNPFAQSYESYV
jgi:hypothetical protein